MLAGGAQGLYTSAFPQVYLGSGCERITFYFHCSTPLRQA